MTYIRNQKTRDPDPSPEMKASMPLKAGVGFKPQHLEAILNDRGRVSWFEVHAENYMVEGGPRLRQLELIRADYPLSLHGVGLSLGGEERLDREHLVRLKLLADRFEPELVSEHVAWSSHGGDYFADLLPVPMNHRSLERIIDAVDEVQSALERQILIENPSSYLDLPESDLVECELLVEIARRTGCGLLIDVNNIFVSSLNLQGNAEAYIDALPGDLVYEIHLAGHERIEVDGETVLIDSHSREVDEAVWSLYRRLISRIGARPTLIEWDNDLPEWHILAEEAARADMLLEQCRQSTLETAS